MSGTIYLIGGGELRDGDTRLIDNDILSQAPKGSTFVFFGFAAQDSADYADTITSVYGKKYTVIVPTEAKGRDFAIDAIKSAAVIYLGGGSTEQLLRVFARWGLVEYLRAAIDQGVHVAGMSAGAQALSTWYVHEENDIFELRKGWGFVPVGVLVHANPASFDKAKSLWSGHGIPDKYPFIAIGESAAWRVSTLETTKVGSGDIWTIAVQK
jgi:cyanophycinase-like exopeptidase